MNLSFELTENKGLRDGLVWKPYKILSVGEIMQMDVGQIFSIIDYLHATVCTQMPTPIYTPRGMECTLTEMGYLSMPLEGLDKLKGDIDTLYNGLELLGHPILIKKARRLQSVIYTEFEEHGPEKAHPHFVSLFPNCQRWITYHLVAVSGWRDDIKEIRIRFLEELSTRLVMVFPGDKIGYFDGTRNSLGPSIPDTLLDAEHDMEEAGKCFALGRYTSCVFHLMRIMERLVQEFASNLGAEVARRGTPVEIKYAEWHEIEEVIATKTRNMPRGERKSRCNAALTTLGAIRLGVRNEVMHPRGFYSDEDAERLLDNVKSFVNDVLTLPLE